MKRGNCCPPKKNRVKVIPNGNAELNLFVHTTKSEHIFINFKLIKNTTLLVLVCK